MKEKLKTEKKNIFLLVNRSLSFLLDSSDFSTTKLLNQRKKKERKEYIVLMFSMNMHCRQ